MQVDRYAFIIGAMKCGTSTLYGLLEQHPQIAGALVKEPEFFCKADKWSRHPAHRLEDLWPEATPEQIRLDGSTSYTKWPTDADVPERMRDAGLSPRFIYIMRDPVRRIESHWDHMRKSPKFDLATGLNERMYIPSRYHAQLERYQAVFPERERYLLMDFSELRDPLAMARRCFDFLGVDPTFEPELTNKNVTKPYSRLELQFERMGVGKAVKGLPDWIKDPVRSLLDRSGSAPKMQLDEAKKAEIRAMLADDMRALQRDYGIDVAQWGFGEQAAEPAPATPG